MTKRSESWGWIVAGIGFAAGLVAIFASVVVFVMKAQL
jgi:hypothetical protein